MHICVILCIYMKIHTHTRELPTGNSTKQLNATKQFMLWGKEIISHSFMMKFPSYFLVLSLVSLLQRGTWVFSSLPHLHPLSTDSSPWHQAILESTLAFLKDASLCSLLPNLFKCIMCYSNPKIPSAQLTSPHFHPKFFFSLNV